VSFEAGRQPEFELLRAQVARDNERPAVIRRRAERDVAYLRLRHLLELPADAVIELDVDLDAASLAAPAPFASLLESAPGAGPAPDRASVQEAAALVAVRDAAVTVARAERLPSINLSSTLGRVGYPSDGFFPAPGDFRTNWSVGATVAMPLFEGGRLKANELSARADLAEAEARLRQARELADLDAATARQDLIAAEAVWAASAGTVQQAERAYQIAELRNREGLSTQLELSDARLALQVAQTTRASAARDLQLARARVALLPNLPVGP
jgi:outer membrane protein TolC